MKKISLLLAFILSAGFVFGQKSFQFEPQLKAENTYDLSHEQSTRMVMNLSGDEDNSDYQEIKEGLEQGGLKLPMVLSNVVSVVASSKMGQMTDEAIPMTVEVNKIEMVTISGDNIEDVDMDDMIGKEIQMMYSTSNGAYTADSSESVGSNDQVDQVFRELLYFIQTDNHWADKTLKKGDSFETNTPLDIPLPTNDDVNMNITTKYEVTKIKKGMAYMTVSQKFGSEGDVETDESESLNFSLKGNGDGEIVYNIDEQFVTENNLKFVGKLTFSMMGLQMDMDIETKSDQTITKR